MVSSPRVVLPELCTTNPLATKLCGSPSTSMSKVSSSPYFSTDTTFSVVTSNCTLLAVPSAACSRLCSA